MCAVSCMYVQRTYVREKTVLIRFKELISYNCKASSVRLHILLTILFNYVIKSTYQYTPLCMPRNAE